MIVPVAIPEVQQMSDNAAERELFIISREMERPPYWHAEEGMNARLAKALRVVQEGRITPNSDGSYTVEGSEHRTYRCADSCSCPQSQKGKSKWCYHMVSVALYIEWCRRTGHPTMQGALSLPPITVDERLAQPVPQTYGARQAEQALGPVMSQEPLREEIAVSEAEYIPEPDAPTGLRQAPRGTTALAPVDDLEQALHVWTTQRAVVQRFLKQELKPNIDYYTLKIGGRESKPSLSKAGAEKVMGWLKIQASFAPDTGTWEMLGRPSDLVAYVCTLRTRSGEVVGEGRGARSLKKDNGDVNKAMKMAEKSACVSAVLRTGCLSDVFTQDLEDQREQEEPASAHAKPSSADLRQRIWALVKAADATITTREACEAYVQRVTGYALVPDQYGAILARLEGR